MESNDIAVRPAKRQLIPKDETIQNYGSQQPVTVSSAAHCAIVLHSPPTPTSTTVWPGEFLEVELPDDAPPDSVCIRTTDWWPLHKKADSFPTVAGSLSHRRKNTHPQLKSWTSLPQMEQTFLSGTCHLHTRSPQGKCTATSLIATQATSTSVNHKTLCKRELWPRQHNIRAKFTSLLDEYDHISNPNIKGYPGAEGPFEARVNMGPVEPSNRKADCPSMPTDNYWNSNGSLMCLKHWVSLNTAKTSTSPSSTYTCPSSTRNPAAVTT